MERLWEVGIPALRNRMVGHLSLLPCTARLGVTKELSAYP